MKMENKKYYEAYDERYKIAHSKGISWSSDIRTPIVLATLNKYNIRPEQMILEIGCGEGRDSRAVLDGGYNLIATDISDEAVKYCKSIMPKYKDKFSVVDCLSDKLNQKFDFIFAVAVIHMLVLDEDRDKFYRFIYDNLSKDGVALICTMGDGIYEMKTDISDAFSLQERNHSSGKMMVTATSCRIVSFDTFENELKRNNLVVKGKGITESFPDFDKLMYAVVVKD